MVWRPSGHLKNSYITTCLLAYKYTVDLLCLDFCRPPTRCDQCFTESHLHTTGTTSRGPTNTITSWPGVCTVYLQRQLEGLHIWGHPLPSASANMESACEHPEVVEVIDFSLWPHAASSLAGCVACCSWGRHACTCTVWIAFSLLVALADFLW